MALQPGQQTMLGYLTHTPHCVFLPLGEKQAALKVVLLTMTPLGARVSIATLFLCVLSYGQESFWGRRISSITIQPPEVLHAEDLARLGLPKAGETLTPEAVASGIDRLFAAGRFTDIVAEADPAPDGGVALRFVTTEARFVGGINVEGKINAPPNRGELASASQLTLGAQFHEEDVTRAVDRLKRLLTSNGLYEAEVQPEVQNMDDGNQAFVTFRIRTGKRARYAMPVIHGETKLAEGTIIRATGWRWPIVHWWRQVNAERTRKGVQGILGKYQSQDRLTAKVELENLEYDAQKRRVTPTLNLNAGPKIEVRAVEAKVSKRKLKRYVPIFQERAVDNDLLVEGARNLRDYFQSQGYYDVGVDFRTRPVENDREVIEYVIARGERFKLAEVLITGNRYFQEEDLRERMFLQPAGFLTMRHGRFSEAFRKKDAENIENLYKANGFRDVKVSTTVDRAWKGKEGDVAVTVQVDEGTQWLVDNVRLEGVEQGDREYFETIFASQPGQPFSEVNMASDRNAVLTWYYSNGYPRAEFKPAWRQVEGSPHHVEILYQVTEGERQFVRDVLVSGLKTTRQKLVDERITLRPGDPLSPTEQSAIQRSFYDMGVFARVDTAIENPEGDTSYKYILYNFDEANRYTVNFGLGAQVARFGAPSSTSLASAGGSTGFSPQASLNVSRLNFMGRGHTVSLRGVYSNLQKRASINYLAPRFQNIEGRSFQATLLYDNTLNVRTFASRREEASVQVQQRLSKATTVLGRLSYRRVSVSDVIIPVLLVPQLVQPVRLGIISANIAQDRRDNPADPKRGIFNTGDISLSTRYLGSQRSFLRLLLRNATYYRLTRNLILARQTQFGWIAPFSAPANVPEAQSVPLPERFFGGGAESLRAFPYNQAGPRDVGEPLVPGGPASQPTGFPLGGNALLFNNIELRFPMIGANIQGVLFHDAGNVYSTISDLSFRAKQRDLNDFNYMVHAVGFGVRYKTPVGPVRLDLAYSINPPSYTGFGGTAQQLLQCNPNLPSSQLPGFCQPSRQNVSHFQFFFSIGQTF